MKNIDELVKELTTEELKIYKSILAHFPATSKESAYDKAIQCGVNFQFIPR